MKRSTNKSATAGKQKTANQTGSAAKGSQFRQQNSQSAEKKDKQGEQTEEQESLLEKFFLDQLKDIYYAEGKILKSLPALEKASTTDELKEAFNDHRHQTEKHVKRLEKVFSMLGQKAEAKKCEAIEGITKECESIIDETEEGSMTRDAALIMAAQKVEHYEIASYGGLVQFAITMNRRDIADILDQTLMEEEDTDHRLTEIAEAHINIEAEEENRYSWNRERETAEIAQ